MLHQLDVQGAKTRWDVRYAGSLWQVDEYHEPRSDLVVAEFELASVDETFELPPWIGEEVSGNPAYYNHTMVTGLRAVSER
jgi:adenylate cyclase